MQFVFPFGSSQGQGDAIAFNEYVKATFPKAKIYYDGIFEFTVVMDNDHDALVLGIKYGHRKKTQNY
jgi:hypothetical protein